MNENKDTLDHLEMWLACEPADEYCTVSWMRQIAADWREERYQFEAFEKLVDKNW
jgi:hypothetical protein